MQGLDKKTSPRLVMDKIPNHPGEIVWFFCLFFGGIAFELIIGWYITRLSTTRLGNFTAQDEWWKDQEPTATRGYLIYSPRILARMLIMALVCERQNEWQRVHTQSRGRGCSLPRQPWGGHHRTVQKPRVSNHDSKISHYTIWSIQCHTILITVA